MVTNQSSPAHAVESPTRVQAPTLLTKLQVMRYLGVSDRTLEKMVGARNFPPPLRLGKLVRWAEPVVVNWLNDRLRAQYEWQPRKRATRA